MPKFIPLTEEQVTFTFEIEPECDVPVRGNAMISGDDAVDEETNQWIEERLQQGDETAWCCLKVTATAPCGVSESDYLGAVCLEDCRGKSGTAVARIVEAFARDSDMHLNALDRLNAKLADAAMLFRAPVGLHVIRTKWLGKTATRGPRIKATDVRTGRTHTLAYDYVDLDKSHAQCAGTLASLLDAGVLIGQTSEQGAGMCFVFAR